MSFKRLMLIISIVVGTVYAGSAMTQPAAGGPPDGGMPGMDGQMPPMDGCNPPMDGEMPPMHPMP